MYVVTDIHSKKASSLKPITGMLHIPVIVLPGTGATLVLFSGGFAFLAANIQSCGKEYRLVLLFSLIHWLRCSYM